MLNEDLTQKSRKVIKKSILSFYGKINIKLTNLQLDCVESIGKSEIVLSEHGMLFPWLGVYRLPLMMASEFGANSTILFIINDQVHRREQIWTRDPNFYFRGENSQAQKNPLIMKCDRRKPLCNADLPSKEYLENFEKRVIGKVEQNILWHNSISSRKINKIKKLKILKNIKSLFVDFTCQLDYVKNYSDFLARFNIFIFQKTNPDLYEKVLFVSFTEIMKNSSEFFDLFINKSIEINQSLNRTIKYQKSHSLVPYKESDLILSELPLWIYCSKCHRRLRPEVKEGTAIFQCCSDERPQEFNNSTNLKAFDVITIEVFTGFLNLKKRVVGNIKNYSLAVDNVLKEVFNFRPPERIVLSSKPIFIGVGTTDVGCEDATLFSSLIELKPEVLGKQLLTEWKQTPIIQSDSI